jgi:hypothetical protein
MINTVFNIVWTAINHRETSLTYAFCAFLFSHRSHTSSPILTHPSQNKSYDKNYQIDREVLSMEPAPNNLVKSINKKQMVKIHMPNCEKG